MDSIVLPAVWALFSGYLLWYMVAVRRVEPITNDEAKMLWKIHRKASHCGGQKFQAIIQKGGKLKGFQCECGYHYTQKKPMVAGTHKVLNKNPWDSSDWSSMDT